MALLLFSIVFPVVVANHHGSTDSSFSIDIRHAQDSSQLTSVEDAIAYDWGQAEPSRVNYGSSPHGHWFYFEIPLVQISEGDNVIVEIHYPTIDYLAFYVVNEEGQVSQEIITGTDFPFASRPIWDD
ncbi:MAG TPA: hypothetical protein DCS92_22305, partial [Gammaproteobacteria bacterium]|nr:hypothetical protein [Gammaproteobacteria bacterium]